jgi:hypothetical protein
VALHHRKLPRAARTQPSRPRYFALYERAVIMRRFAKSGCRLFRPEPKGVILSMGDVMERHQGAQERG